jgi:hypothetical protein
VNVALAQLELALEELNNSPVAVAAICKAAEMPEDSRSDSGRRRV